jgi:hypothetical protein
MLLTALLDGIFWILNASVSVFPAADTTWLTSFQSGIGNIFGIAAKLNSAFPVDELFNMMGIFFTVVAAVVVATFVRKIVSAFTGGGGA